MRSAFCAFACLVVVALPAAAATRTWTGTADATWTNAANWGGTAPVAGDDLVFPAGALNESNTNNFPAGTPFPSITLAGDAYTLSGSLVALGAGGIQATGGNAHSILLPLTLTAPQIWHLGNSSPTTTTVGAINLNGVTLTIDASDNATIAGPINGTGSITLTNSFVDMTGVNTTLAPVTLSNSGFIVDGTYPGPITGNIAVGVAAGATAGAITLTGPFSQFVPGFSTPAGACNTGSISVSDVTIWLAFIDDATNYSAVNVTGTIKLDRTILQLLGQTSVPPGTVLTIVRNDGAEPINGTYIGLPEGGNITADGPMPQNFIISYHGGTGNDIVLIAQAPATIPTTTALTVTPPVPELGQDVVLTATVTGPPTPTGTVTFIDFAGGDITGLSELATVPLNGSGVATFTTNKLAFDQHLVIALYNGGGSFQPSSDGFPLVVAASVPALSDYALALLAVVLALSGAIAIRP